MYKIQDFGLYTWRLFWKDRQFLKEKDVEKLAKDWYKNGKGSSETALSTKADSLCPHN